MKTLTLSKPMNPSRRKPRQRITRAEIVASAMNTEVVQPVKVETGGTPEKTAMVSQIYKCLLEKYPAMKDCKPLVAGSHKQVLKERDPLWSYHKTRQAMSRLCKSDEYLKAMADKGSRRYNLDGSDAGQVSEDHREHAQRLLDERTNKNAHDDESQAQMNLGQDSLTETTSRRGPINAEL